MSFLAASKSNSPLLTLPNELFFEVASHLESFQDLNSLVRTSSVFHMLFNTHLYRRAVAADDAVRQDIVSWVLSECQVNSLKLLLDTGLSVHQELGWNSEQLLLWFSRNCFHEELSVPLAQLLIERGADITEQCPVDSSTPLHGAIINGNYDLAALLLAAGADVDAATTTKWHRRTPLHFAILNPYPDASMIDLLVAHGATVDARDGNEDTPLLFAARQGNAHHIPALLGHGADACAYDKYRNTPLHYLKDFRNSDHGVAKLLLEHGADVNATDIAGRTPLHLCSRGESKTVMWGDIWKVKILVENGADVNGLSRDGFSPLREAFDNLRFSGNRGPMCSDEALAVIRLLITHGADISFLDSEERAEAIKFGLVHVDR
jgi:ankyrin repeat protein